MDLDAAALEHGFEPNNELRVFYSDCKEHKQVKIPFVLGRSPVLRFTHRRLPILSLLLAPFFSNVTNTSFLIDDLLYRTGPKVPADASRLRRRIKEAVLADLPGRCVL